MTTEKQLNLVCPHCGNREHFYQKMSYSGTSEFQVNNHGDCDDTCDNSNIHEGQLTN